MKVYKAVLFDFGGTLDSDGLAWKEHFELFYQAAGIHWPAEKFDRCFYFSDDYLTAKGLKKVSYTTMLNRQVNLVFKKADVANNKMQKQIASSFKESCFKNLQRNKPLIQALAKKYKLGIVSNFYGNLPHLIKEIGFDSYFDAVIDSRWQGCIKPDARIFNAALQKLNVSVEHSVFVGDSLKRDMAGAKCLGMDHIWMNPNTANDALRCCKNDRIIRTLLDLEKILL